VNVAVGTDSRASNPDLSVLAELRFLARLDRTLPGGELLRLGTLNGAKALGLEQDFGSLKPGKLANLAIVPLPQREANDPYELLFDSDLPAMATVCRGKLYRATASCSSALRTPE
jgi:cytosine/adenosine deaminase-related metal-dependent hydrolase